MITFTPADGETGVARNITITVDIDDAAGISEDTTLININGRRVWENDAEFIPSVYAVTKSVIVDGYSYSINPVTDFKHNEGVEVYAQAENTVATLISGSALFSIVNDTTGPDASSPNEGEVVDLATILAPAVSQPDEEVSMVADTPRPWGTWASGTTVNFAKAPNQIGSTIYLTFADGYQRSASGTLAWDAANSVGDLGFDEAASEAAGDKWLYFYAVPKTGDDTLFTVVASDNDNATGPASRSTWIKLWASYRGSGSLSDIYQTGYNVFRRRGYKQIFEELQDPVVATTVDLSTHIPIGATEVFITSRNLVAGSDINTNYLVNFHTSDGLAIRGETNKGGPCNIHTWVPVASSQDVRYSTVRLVGTAQIYMGTHSGGWIDGEL